MKRRIHCVFGLLVAAALTGCVTHHHHGERVVYRSPPQPNGDVHRHPSGEPLPAPGTYGDDDDDQPRATTSHDYAERATPPWYVTSSPDDAPRRAAPPAGPSAAPQGKPPVHAPAKGLRRKTAYFYYPSWEVYYCPSRSVYFWIETDEWVVGVELPERIKLDADKAVPLRLLTDDPYELHDQVRKKHGPKKSRKAKSDAKGQGNGKKKGQAGRSGDDHEPHSTGERSPGSRGQRQNHGNT